jgi:PAT family beta-lactamase induction signal transducer AmpG
VIRTLIDSLSIYRDRRVLAILFLGFSSGLPLALTPGTLAIWMRREGVDLATIGLFALVGLPYTLKFLWAPLIDRLPIPWLTRALGRRRSWTVVIQLGLMGAIIALGSLNPVAAPLAIAAFALLVAFLSASQDIVIDAYRIDILNDDQQGAGAAATQFGYRFGMLASGAGALYLADQASWSFVYAVMAGLVTVGLVAILLSPEPAGDGAATAEKDRSLALALRADRSWLTPSLAGALAWAKGALADPFLEFTRRHGWNAAVILLFVLLYKQGDAFAGVMANPFYVDMGFTNVEIANVSKMFGVAATLLGVFLGGAMVARIGVMKALLIGGILQMLSNLMFAAQAILGHDVGFLVVTIFTENLAGGLGSAAFVAYLSLLCSAEFTATQYALLSSFMAFGRVTLPSLSGVLVGMLGWVNFFILSTIIAVPGLLLLLWMMRNMRAPQRAP